MTQLASLPTAFLAFLVGAPCLAQKTLLTFDGDSQSDNAGSAVARAGDVDGDGVDDWIVGAPDDDPHGTNSGRAFVLSGADGVVLYAFDGISAGDRFGEAVSGVGDLDGDGTPDVAVGAPYRDDNGVDSGSVQVFSGASGLVLYTFLGEAVGDRFGSSVDGAGDVDGDGRDDLIVGGPGTLPSAGMARVHSGATGSELFTFRGDSLVELLGRSVAGAGDVDGDGHADLIVGAPGDDDNGLSSGSARLFAGADGSLMYKLLGDTQSDLFGIAVSGAGDVDGDGLEDVVVGAYGDSANGQKAGMVRVFSGVSGAALFTFYGDVPLTGLGSSVGAAGDVDGDGRADVVAGGPDDGAGAGRVWVWSGADGALLFVRAGTSAGDAFGSAVCGAGDVNGDGYDDLLVGAPLADHAGKNSGRAWLLSGCVPLGTTYCSPAVANSSGSPAHLSAYGSEVVTDRTFVLSARQLPVNPFGYFLASQTPGFVQNPGGSQGNLCLGGAIGRFVAYVASSGQSGSLNLTVDLKHMPPPTQTVVLPGDTWSFQAWFRDANPTATSNFSDAVTVDFL